MTTSSPGSPPGSNPPPRRPPRFRAPWAALGLALTLVIWYARPFLVPGHVGLDGDSLYLFYPAARLAHEELLAGRLPLWNPYQFFGAPLAANLLIPVFYPPMTLALLLPQPFGLYCCLVFSFLLAGMGAYGLCRKGLGLSPLASFFAGLTLALSGPFAAQHAHFNQVMAAAWMPWALWAGLSLAGAGRPLRPALALGCVMGFQALAGQPQFSVYAGLMLTVPLILGLARRERRAGRLAAWGLAFALAAGIGAVVLLPGYELSRQSLRIQRGFDFAASGSLPWSGFMGLIRPGWFPDGGTGRPPADWSLTEFSIFFGWLGLPLAAIGLAARRRERIAWALFSIALIGAILAVGRHLPVYRILLAALPPLEGFRAPARAFILSVVAGSALAAMGLDAVRAKLAAREAGPPSPRAALACCLALLGIQALSFHLFRPEGSTEVFDKAIADLPGIDREIPSGEPVGRVFRLMDEIDYLDASEAATVARARVMQPGLNALRGVRVIRGYEGGMLPLTDDALFVRHFRASLYSRTPDPDLLALMGVRYVISDKPVEGEFIREVARRTWPSLEPWLTPGSPGAIVYENLRYRGDAFTPGDWPGVDWELLARKFQGPVGQAPVSIYLPGLAMDRSEREPAMTLRRVSPVRFEVTFAGDAPDELLLSEGWAPGWFGTNEKGERVRGEYAAPFLIRFAPPRGSRSLSIQYRPISVRLGAAVSLGTLALAVIVLGWTCWGPRLLRRRGGVQPRVEG